jgi:hypothetical protein
VSKTIAKCTCNKGQKKGRKYWHEKLSPTDAEGDTCVYCGHMVVWEREKTYDNEEVIAFDWTGADDTLF